VDGSKSSDGKNIIKGMPNAIKYSTSAQTLALKKGNYWIGTGDVGKGPTSTTDYYNGITPPAGGYTIYLNKASGGPSIYTAANDSALISLSNTIAGQTFATAAAALAWFATQTDKMVFNSDYPAIITDGLVLNLDAGFTPSYPTTGTTWYDVSSGGNNGTLTNGPAFSSSNGGIIYFDGTDDYANINLSTTYNEFSYCMTFRGSSPSYLQLLVSMGFPGTWAGGFQTDLNDDPSYTAWFFWDAGAGDDSLKVPSSTSNWLDGNWRQITFTHTGSTNKIYENGLEIQSAVTGGVQTFSIGGTNYVIRIAKAHRNDRDYNWQGDVGGFSLYSRALTAAEVLQNFNATKSRYGL
jgi:hypothetical protein